MEIKKLQELLSFLSINSPTKIQELCFNPILKGKCVIGLSPTGTGKTLAFVLPMLLNIEDEKRLTQCLILTPTRELGAQIFQVISQAMEKIPEFKSKNIILRTLFGGIPKANQAEEIAKNPHIIVGTPGRVLDLLQNNNMNVKNLKLFALDEADIMVGMGFSEQILSIHEYLKSELQTVLFSATRNEKCLSIENSLFGKNEPLFLNAYENKENEKKDCLQISHQFVKCSLNDRFQTLVSLINEIKNTDDGQVIIFCHTKENVADLAKTLQNSGYHAEPLTGDLGTVERSTVMRHFKSGHLKYLVATNIAARGIDVIKLSAVVHYDIPYTAEDYTHKSGRTGRGDASSGISISICYEKNTSYYLSLMKQLGIDPKEKTLEKKFANNKKMNSEVIKFEKIYLNRGKQDKIRPGDILGAFIKDLKFEKEDIGGIFIFNHFSHIEINQSKKKSILNKSFSIKNLAVKIKEVLN